MGDFSQTAMDLHMKPHTNSDIDTSTDAIHAFLKQLPFIADTAADADVDVLLRRDDANGFVALLEAEFLKIHAFQRELPLSTLLLKHVIQVLKQEASQHPTYRDADQPLVLEEFIPLEKVSGIGNTKIKRADVDDDNDDGEKDECGSDKKNWMSSVQLWTTATMEDANPSDNMSTSNNMSTTLKESRKLEKEDAREHELSLVIPRKINHLNEQRDMKSGGTTTLLHSSSPSTFRKQRRCWSAELHRRFVDALTKLGGAHVATPKQIRELMGVDGLTNDEVKSHLQKYRLHAQRVANKSATGEYSESAKPSSSQSRSPDGPLQFHGPAAGDSMDDEDDIYRTR